SMFGVQIIGDGNTLYDSVADANVGHGVVVQGNGNTVDTVEANANNGGDGIRVTGNSNTIANSTAGGEQLSNGGNGANGITVVGKGNLVVNNEVYRNRGDGINVSGGVATNPNVVRSNTAGAPTMGNRGNGIALGGTGSGASSPVELESN